MKDYAVYIVSLLQLKLCCLVFISNRLQLWLLLLRQSERNCDSLIAQANSPSENVH